MMLTLTLIALVLSLIPAWMFHRNVSVYTLPLRPDVSDTAAMPSMSVLIPARNEAHSIRAAVESVLASRQVDLEVIVLDDHSEDDTAAIVREVAAQYPRLRLETAPPLPPGWCGKQHACTVLSRLGRHPLLVFLDADVRLMPDGLARLAAFIENSGADLVSGVPRQEMGTWSERLAIPLILFLLLGFLPLRRMRSSRHPSYGSGCGQLFLTRRETYDKVGGHAAIRTSWHDGLMLPRAFREAGYKTDLCDATEVATCLMYHNFKELWNGLAKNATEGLASTRTIVPATVLLLGGQVLPFVLLPVAVLGYGPPSMLALSILAMVASYYPRFRGLRRFQQSWIGALLHPCGIVLLLAIQWYARGRGWLGRPMSWKGRPYLTTQGGG